MWKPKKWILIFITPKFFEWWSKINGFNVIGITLPLIVLLDKNEPEKRGKEKEKFKKLVNHESIHIYQQMELFVVIFYILYGLFYFINLIKFRNHYEAYIHIPFEVEAYKNDQNLTYLENRKLFSWVKYITMKNPYNR